MLSGARLFRWFSRRLSYVQGQSSGPRTREYFYYIDHQGQLFLDDTKVKNFITCFKDKKFLAFFFQRVKMNTTGHYEDDFPFISPCGREFNYIRCDDLPVVFTHILDSGGHVIQNIAEYGKGGGGGEGGGANSRSKGENSSKMSSVDRNAPKTSTSRLQSIPSARTPDQTEHTSDEASSETNEMLSYGGTEDLLTIPFQPSKLCMLPDSGRVYHAGLGRLGGVGLVKSSLAIELSRFFEYEALADERAAPVRFVWRGRVWEIDESVVNALKRMPQVGIRAQNKQL